MEEFYKRIGISATSICVRRSDIFAVSKVQNRDKLCLLLFDPVNRKVAEVAPFKGSEGLLLSDVQKKMFVGIDNKLIMRTHSESWKVVLESRNPSNLFWHMATSEDGMMYVQEYGEPPTGIYVSHDGEEWKLLVTAQDIDKRARHFHSIAYDQYREMLIATLGDGNYTKIAVSMDSGENGSRRIGVRGKSSRL